MLTLLTRPYSMPAPMVQPAEVTLPAGKPGTVAAMSPTARPRAPQGRAPLHPNPNPPPSPRPPRKPGPKGPRTQQHHASLHDPPTGTVGPDSIANFLNV